VQSAEKLRRGQVLRQAVRRQLLARNPAEAVRPPRPARAPVRTLDEEQTTRLLKTAQGTRLHVPVLVAVMTGLRRGKLLALRWSDMDLEAATLSVTQTLRVTHNGLVFAPPKTGKSRRLLALPPLVVEALREHRRRQLEDRLRLGPVWQEHGLVFPGPDGRPWHPATLSCSFRELCKRAGMEIRFHDLRHSHATQLLKAGVHPKIVNEWLGHSTVGITLDIYSHLLPGMQEEAVGRLEAALRAALKESGN